MQPGVPPAVAAAPAGKGFTAKIDFSNQLHADYVKATIQLDSTAGPMTAERDLSIRFLPVDFHYPATQAVLAEFRIPFSQGQRSATHQCVFPKWTYGLSYRIEISEDGTPLSDYVSQIALAVDRVDKRSQLSLLSGPLVKTVWFVGDAPSIKFMDTASPTKVASRAEIGVWSSGSLQDFPDDWRLARTTSVLVLSMSDLTTPAFLKKQQSVRNWLMMGGVLVVQQSPPTSELSELLQVTLENTGDRAAFLTQSVESVSYEAREYQGNVTVWWQEQAAVLKARQQAIARQNDAPSMQANQQMLSVSQQGKLNGSVFDSQSTERFKREMSDLDLEIKLFEQRWNEASVFQVGVGTVVSMPENDLQSALDFKLLNRLAGFRRSPLLNRGVDPLLGDRRNRRWLIPGVAQPPVYTFIGILTLFVLLVGPLAYRWTGRSGRAHLMFLIAPLLAIMTTVLMFTYSIVADGFGTKIRVRQITWLDGKSGSACERTRATLFAGISPRDGLRFPADAEVFPYPSAIRTPWRELPGEIRELRNKVTVDDEHQTFNQAVFPTRTQTQFVTHQMKQDVGGVRLSDLPAKLPDKVDAGAEASTGAETKPVVTAKLTSTLSFDLTRVVVRSLDGRYWTAESLPAGKTIDVVWVAADKDVSKELGTLYTLYRPLGDASFAGRSRKSQDASDVILMTNRFIDSNAPPVTDGSLELMLNQMLFVSGELASGLFVGLAEPSADAIPSEGAELIQSVRYVMGTLQ